MRIPPTTYLRLQSAHDRGDHLTVLAEGDAVAHEIKGDPAFGDDSLPWLASIALMVGAAHAAYERLEVAASYLEYGLAQSERVAAAAPPSSAASSWRERRLGRGGVPPVGLGRASGGAADTGPFAARASAPPPIDPYAIDAPTAPPDGSAHPSGGAPGTGMGLSRSSAFPSPSARIVTGKLDTSPTDWAELLLLELYIYVGRYDDALARITPLLEPFRPTTTRFAATRAQASIATLRGDDETAHFLLNTATGLANRVPSKYRVALVEGDRAIVLAGQGRTREAVAIADRLLDKFIRPAVGVHQLWSNAEGAAIALTVSRAAANEGDSLTAERLLRLGEQATQPLGRAYFAAQVELTRGVNQALAGDHVTAESSLIAALSTFNTYGYRPAAALTLLEQGRLAHRRGLVRSARPLYERALDELRQLGQPREQRLTRQLIAALDDQRPPSASSVPAATRPFPRYPART